MLDTRQISEAIERAEIHFIRAVVESARRLRPELRFCALDVAGGVAPFVGVGSPLSEAIGLALYAPASSDDLGRLTQFYEECGTPPRILVSPLADGSLVSELARRGYVPVQYRNLLACDLSSAEAARDARIGISSNPIAWGRVSAMGFSGVEDPPVEASFIGTIISAIPAVVALEAHLDGAVVATGAMDVQGELAGLFAGSTLPAARGHGLQSAMIGDRLARAREAGARYARANAEPGGASERNFRHHGFEVLYTRAVWQKPAAQCVSAAEATSRHQ
jgi:GNAT superfamily N-acetyltransferase